jgi:hypothetical protein
VESLSVGAAAYWRCVMRTMRVLKGESHLIGRVAVEVHDVSAGEVPIGGRCRVLKVQSETEDWVKGESYLIGRVAVEVHDVSAGLVPIGGCRRVLQVHSENEECFKRENLT